MFHLTIKQVSELVGLPTKTIRFYEESKVIAEATRANNGYRIFSKESVEQLKLIKYARDLGLPLSEIKKLIKGCEDKDCQHTLIEMRLHIDNYLALLNEKIAEFSNLSEKLNKLKNNLDFNSDTCDENLYCCNILKQLSNYSDTEKGGD